MRWQVMWMASGSQAVYLDAEQSQCGWPMRHVELVSVAAWRWRRNCLHLIAVTRHQQQKLVY